MLPTECARRWVQWSVEMRRVMSLLKQITLAHLHDQRKFHECFKQKLIKFLLVVQKI